MSDKEDSKLPKEDEELGLVDGGLDEHEFTEKLQIDMESKKNSITKKDDLFGDLCYMYVPSKKKEIIEAEKVENVKKSQIPVKKKKKKKKKPKVKKELIYEGMGKMDEYDEYDVW